MPDPAATVYAASPAAVRALVAELRRACRHGYVVGREECPYCQKEERRT